MIGVGFVCAGLAVLKKLISNHERTKEAIITYLVALITLVTDMAADLGGFTDVLLLVGLAAGLVWWYYNKPTPKVEQKTGKKPGEKKEDGAPAASVTPVINIIFQSDVVEEEVAEKLADLFHSGRTFYYTGGKVGKEAQEPPHFIRYKEVEWKDLEKINV